MSAVLRNGYFLAIKNSDYYAIDGQIMPSNEAFEVKIPMVLKMAYTHGSPVMKKCYWLSF
ncbi:MAG TPA: hypothetical protein DD381_04610 [Lentisphaeria bacterium]|nr:MAG: hypothetical protein A2X47_07040 [Lentisphaerae bacterium GWF2_38_69]HBM15613.1 hypothetical protein [Lentisphaeria bacterium]